MAKQIPPLDLMWLVMETPASPTHVGALLLFEKPKGRPGLVNEIVSAYRSFVPAPPFNYIPELVGVRVPRFREASSYDARYHNQHLALPAGATTDDLLRLVADLHESMLDRQRPLFRNWIIDNVPDNQFAIYVKVHHAIVDGVAGTSRLYASLSADPRQGIQPPAFAADGPVRDPTPPKALVERLGALGLTAKRQTFAYRDMTLATVKKRLGILLGADPVGSAPFTAHRGPMNEPLQMARSIATLSLPLDEMQGVGRYFGATLNDLAVSIVDEGVHRYLRGTDRALQRRLVAFCPVSLRGVDDKESGSKVSAMFVHLGEHSASVTERIAQVTKALGTAKQEMRSMTTAAAMAYAVALLGVAELATATRFDRVTPPLANIVISNVPGARQQMYLNGARLAGNFPMSAIAMSVGLNVTLTSCHDRMDFGFVGNGATMYDLPQLVHHVQQAYEELKSATLKKRPTTRRPARTSPVASGGASPRHARRPK